MILVDTSVWIDHLRAGQPALVRLLGEGLVLSHPWVIGELALGHLEQRAEVITLLGSLPHAAVATPEEVLHLVDSHHISGLGVGYVDAQLLAATRLTAAGLWTKDGRLVAAAVRLGCAVDPTSG